MSIIGGIGKAIKKVVSAPFKVVGSLLGAGGGTANVATQDVSGVDIQASTASQSPESPLYGSDTSLDKKKKRGKSGLLIQKNSSGKSSNGSNYSGLNI